jgi:hypothetical protein
VFVDLQAARLKRQGLADETRIDATLGVAPAKHWLAAGPDLCRPGRSRPVLVLGEDEVSVVRSFGDWSVPRSAGATRLSGRETARDRGVVLALWRRL